MRNTMWTKEQVNEAIFTVLKTKYKKQAPEAFEIVKQAGYEYVKTNGVFRVFKRETDKFVELNDSGYGRYAATYVVYGYYRNMRAKLESWDNSKFDFVSCLDTPYNKVWWEVLNRNDRSRARDQWDRIKSAKWSIKYEVDRMAEIQRKIESLQKELVHAAENRVRDEQHLSQLRKEYGLA